MKVIIKYASEQSWIKHYINNIKNLPNYNQDWKYSEVNNIQDIPNYNKITHLYCSDNQLSSLPDLPPTLINLYCSNNQLSSLPDLPSTINHLWHPMNQFIKKDQYQESIIKEIIYVIPWTNSKEYFLNNLICMCHIYCSKCKEKVILKEQCLFIKNYTIKTKICNNCNIIVNE